MNKEEIQASSQKKVDAITNLCKQLEVVVSAEQMITEQGFIKHVVYYTDTEKYDVDKEPKEEKNEDTTPKKQAPKTPADTPVSE